MLINKNTYAYKKICLKKTMLRATEMSFSNRVLQDRISICYKE